MIISQLEHINLPDSHTPYGSTQEPQARYMTFLKENPSVLDLQWEVKAKIDMI